jgi:hypothetical protein
MRRTWRVLIPLFLLAVIGAGATLAWAGSGGPRAGQGGGGHAFYGRGYFAVGCGFSHRNNDDPIVFPRQMGLSHNHTYFGNTSTNAFSTAGTMRGGRTTCSLRADTAAYWVPTLLVDGRPVEPLGATVYYVRRTLDRVQAFPAGLQMIAGNAAARDPQGLGITLWSCAQRGVRASATIPTCSVGSRSLNSRRSGLRLQVNYPNCWNGSTLDSANHRSHMAYSVRGACPASHPVAVPALIIVVRYGVAGGSDAQLSSVGQFSGHADFVNAWDQDTLERLVARYLNGRGRR